MEIRLANASDIPGILNLLGQVGHIHRNIRPDLFREHPLKYDHAALEELLKDSQRPIFVAVEETVLGYCFCIRKETKDNPVLQDEKSLYIDDLCVDESCRGKHIGQQLYDYVRDYARGEGFRTITLNVWCGNDSAMAFYKKQGMQPRNITMESVL